MKHILYLLLAVLLAISVTACGLEKESDGNFEIPSESVMPAESANEVTSSPSDQPMEPPSPITPSSAPSENDQSPNPSVDKNDKQIPKTSNDEPGYGDPDDGHLVRDGYDENDHVPKADNDVSIPIPDPNAPLGTPENPIAEELYG